MRRVLILSAALLLSCTKATPTEDDSGPLPAQMSPQDCCDYVIAKAGQTMLTKYLSCCVAMLATACPPIGPDPVPPQPIATGGAAATGGSSSTGGKVATGGKTATGGALATGGSPTTGGTTNSPATTGPTPLQKCIAKFTASASVKNVAKQSGNSVSAIVNGMCSDPTILGGFR